MNTIATASLPTPDGIFTVLADEAHVLASGWITDAEALRALIHPSLRAPLRESPTRASGASASDVLKDALEAVRAYYDGDHRGLSALPVRQQSGPFRERAWEVLRGVEPGAPLSYAEYASLLGRPDAARAAAGACAMNAAALFVPCHRILRTDGGLGGFRYGTEVKRSLLDRESSRVR